MDLKPGESSVINVHRWGEPFPLLLYGIIHSLTVQHVAAHPAEGHRGADTGRKAGWVNSGQVYHSTDSKADSDSHSHLQAV